MRLCTFCQRDLSTASDSFSAPVGSEGSFKDFCSQPCMKKYEDLLSTDVEIIRVEPGKPRGVNKCSVCQKVRVHCWSVLITFWGLAGSELACQVCCWSPKGTQCNFERVRVITHNTSAILKGSEWLSTVPVQFQRVSDYPKYQCNSKGSEWLPTIPVQFWKGQSYYPQYQCNFKGSEWLPTVRVQFQRVSDYLKYQCNSKGSEWLPTIPVQFWKGQSYYPQYQCNSKGSVITHSTSAISKGQWLPTVPVQFQRVSDYPQYHYQCNFKGSVVTHSTSVVIMLPSVGGIPQPSTRHQSVFFVSEFLKVEFTCDSFFQFVFLWL